MSVTCLITIQTNGDFFLCVFAPLRETFSRRAAKAQRRKEQRNNQSVFRPFDQSYGYQYDFISSL